MIDPIENEQLNTPEETKTGLTPSELVHRHYTNENDVITDEDMENLQINTETDEGEVHVNAAVAGRLEEEDNDEEKEDDLEEEDNDVESEDDDDKKNDPPKEHHSHVTPWDIMG